MEAAAEFREHALTLAPETAGLRFDQALAQALPQYSRARLKTWIESGAVQVHGRPLRGKDRVLGGEDERVHPELRRCFPGRKCSCGIRYTLSTHPA